jgi:hypothetical protein
MREKNRKTAGKYPAKGELKRDPEIAEWNKILQQHGLGVYRGHNSKKMIYGIQLFDWGPASLLNCRKMKYEESIKIKTHLHNCSVCGKAFTSRRRDAKICGGACRMRKLRDR